MSIFTGAMDLVVNLVKAQTENRLKERLRHYAKPKLLTVDELGYLPLEPDAAHLFFQLVCGRYERGAMLLTSNRAVGEWGTVFGDAVVAHNPGPAASPQSRRHDPERQLPPTRKTSQRVFVKARCDARNRNCINMKVGQFFMSPPGQIRMSLDKRDLAIRSLDMAVALRQPPKGCIHHTDRGSQGGFNRSSQHFNFGGVDDKNRQTKIRTVHAGQIILARATACLAT